MVEIRDEEWFKKIVKGCFSYRRKTLINALKHSDLSLPHDLEAKNEENRNRSSKKTGDPFDPGIRQPRRNSKTIIRRIF